MKRLLLLIALFITTTGAFAVIQTPAGIVNVDNGSIVVNGEELYVIRQYDGKRRVLHNEIFFEISGKNPGLFLSIYRDKADPSQQSRTEYIIIIDATGKEIRRSNVLDTGIEFDWGDNNYVLFDHGAMYFGIYSPKRMQFVYRDGKLEENKGPWRGPAKPEKYIEPEHPGPCYNVADEPACLEEVEQAEAAKRAKVKHKAKSAVRAPTSSTSQ
ncbi:hypothetical protein [Sulfuriferula nivalis]|uniref:Uncharacterized protein n=1 Tax=Sulfuriferula nivalis TaxID=2675298 RepID=A0A809RI95_9PROT|nr:hypothetical protein [Sulfuriferula nivalis]BBP01629.1 hypothetical protein SFSGTM_23370 [Sulfuriferula nivalis]